jgi:hypothetical protein
MGEQPIARIMNELGLKPHDLVSASTEQITYKMVARACKGRRLTPHVQSKIINAINSASGRHFSMPDLFTY